MNALIENRRKEKENDRRMIEANGRSQILYAAEKRERIILDQEKIIKDLQDQIENMNACVQRDRRVRIGMLMVASWVVAVLFLAIVSG